jgi:hypothetical protein
MEILNLGGSYEPSARSSKKKFKVVLGIGLLAAVMGMGSTLAASITLNAGSAVEFGQGIASTAACDSAITITPFSTYANAVAGDFLFSSFTLSNVDTRTAGCASKYFIIKAFTNTDTSSAGAAYLYAGDSTTATPLPLGVKYTDPTIVTGGVDIAGYTKYNTGIALQLSSTGSTCTVTVAGTADKSVVACAVTPGSDATYGNATYTVTLYSAVATDAKLGVPTSAVSKLTLESTGSAPAGFA